MIADNVKYIRERIAVAAHKSGRKPEDIMFIGVTKTIDTNRIAELLDLGVVDLGENKVQELLEKYPVFGDRPNWHLIGHLQTNKVKFIIDKVKLIHSVDSLKLATEINKRASAISKVMDILIEVNVAEEESKFGVNTSNLYQSVDKICRLDNIKVKGLMTVAPYVKNPEENRETFRKLRYLCVDIQERFMNNIDMVFLSMGMTNDYEVAIEEGANIIRVGTGIFGERDYST